MSAGGTVTVLSGPPCSGKSSVGRTLATWAAAEGPRRTVVLEVDALFVLLLPGSDRSRTERLLAYRAAHDLTATFLGAGLDVVLECTYARREQRQSLLDAVEADGPWRLRVAEFAVTPDVALARFRARDEGTDLDEESLRERVGSFPFWSGATAWDASDADVAGLARAVWDWSRAAPADVDPDAWVRAGRGWN